MLNPLHRRAGQALSTLGWNGCSCKKQTDGGVNKTKTFKYFLIRKLIHFLSGIFSIALLGQFPSIAKELLLCVASLILIADFLRRKGERWRAIFLSIFGKLLKSSEKEGQITGAATFMITVAILAFIFPYGIVTTSILILSISDPLASIAGKQTPIRKIRKEKTLAGSLIFFISCMIICYFWMPISTLSIIAVSLLITLIELMAPSVWENILIGLGSAMLLLLAF